MSECSAYQGIIYPKEVDLLVGALNRLCHAARIERNSETALRLASLIIAEFQSGQRCHKQLVSAVAVSPDYRNAILDVTQVASTRHRQS